MPSARRVQALLDSLGTGAARQPHLVSSLRGDAGVYLVQVLADRSAHVGDTRVVGIAGQDVDVEVEDLDRKSTRLNSSHHRISYAVFCLVVFWELRDRKSVV